MEAAMLVLALVLMSAAVYAQYRLPRFTSSPRNVVLARLVLAVVGIGFGYVSAGIYGSDRTLAVLAFFTGFGAVHVPAALILLIKRERGSGKS